jgi:hypothetical protein
MGKIIEFRGDRERRKLREAIRELTDLVSITADPVAKESFQVQLDQYVARLEALEKFSLKAKR